MEEERRKDRHNNRRRGGHDGEDHNKTDMKFRSCKSPFTPAQQFCKPPRDQAGQQYHEYKVDVEEPDHRVRVVSERRCFRQRGIGRKPAHCDGGYEDQRKPPAPPLFKEKLADFADAAVGPDGGTFKGAPEGRSAPAGGA